MTRIIAGRWGGRRLRTPTGQGTRPTSDRVRESLFSSLEGHFGSFDGLAVLDLFAGSGALGLEAMSRGAASCDFVEANAKAAAVISGNVRELGVSNTSVHRQKAEQFLNQAGRGPYDVVFVDPPYRLPSDEVAAIVAAIPLADDGVIVVERSSRDPWEWPKGLKPLRDKRYGETHLWYGQ